MIKVYFESGRHAECVATFISEEVYMAALPSLEALAESQGMSVTESIEHDSGLFEEAVKLIHSASGSERAFGQGMLKVLNELK